MSTAARSGAATLGALRRRVDRALRAGGVAEWRGYGEGVTTTAYGGGQGSTTVEVIAYVGRHAGTDRYIQVQEAAALALLDAGLTVCQQATLVRGWGDAPARWTRGQVLKVRA